MHFTEQSWKELAQDAQFRSGELAKLCQVSLRTLQRHFAKQYQRSLGEWMRELRLDHAYHRVSAGESVKYVAFDLGFKQLSHFSRSFKEKYGVPPSAISHDPVGWAASSVPISQPPASHHQVAVAA